VNSTKAQFFSFASAMICTGMRYSSGITTIIGPFR
jgi:hypothetical protein